MICVLQQTLLKPLAASVYPLEGSAFDKHHSFIVQYEPGKDLGLDLHTDDSDVTFNCCLGREFTNATLTLCGVGGTPRHRQFQQHFVPFPSDHPVWTYLDKSNLSLTDACLAAGVQIDACVQFECTACVVD